MRKKTAHTHEKRNENRSLENLISVETKLHMNWHMKKRPAAN